MPQLSFLDVTAVEDFGRQTSYFCLPASAAVWEKKMFKDYLKKRQTKMDRIFLRLSFPAADSEAVWMLIIYFKGDPGKNQ